MEFENPSMKMQLRRSQRVKVERKGESESPEEIKPEKKQVRRERTRKDEDQIKIETKSIDSDHNSEEDYSSVHQHLSKYELCRLENIRQNKAFLCFLELHQDVEALRAKPKSSQRGIKKVKTVEVLPCRKSLRLQKKETEVLSLSKAAAAGPARENHIKQDQEVPDLKMYQEQLNMMSIDASAVTKVVNNCTLFSAHFHPCSSTLFMAAGDYSGHLGLLTMGVDWGDDGVLLFKPQSGVVGCLAFSSAQPTNLLTVSNDGSTHSMDLERALFEEVYHSDSGLKSFDFLSVDCSTLLMDGDVVIVDRRTPRMSYEWLHTLDPKCVSSVHVHPLQRQYFAAAESRSVHIYDCRHLKRKVRSPVCKLKGHSGSVSSAAFSPCTGNSADLML